MSTIDTNGFPRNFTPISQEGDRVAYLKWMGTVDTNGFPRNSAPISQEGDR
jgi:hypothetical protein